MRGLPYFYSSPELTSEHPNHSPGHSIGFWRAWGIAVGVMIGSGIFLLPSVMAPYGAISLLGWTMSGIGVILMAAVFGRLARRTKNGVGGPYAYTRDAFGTLAGFLIG